MDAREKAVVAILRQALDLEPEQRAAFVRDQCGDDADLEQRVQRLLSDADAEVESAGSAGAGGLDEDPLIGVHLGPFRVIERIGRGGMGVVYRGTREGADFQQEVALKLIRRGFDFDDIRTRFLRERRILARLDHPNLARLIDGGMADDGRPWFALEFVRGEAISAWCDAHRLDVRARVQLFLSVCAAVQHAHTQLIVHRDLKPGNILVDEEGHVRLLDFGIARLLADEDTEATATVGARTAYTPEYAAPEQLDGGPVGVATDVYALGVVLYELVTGVRPWQLDRNHPEALAEAIRHQPPQAPTQAIARDGAEACAARLDARHATVRSFRTRVRGDLSRILDKALAKEPARRYAGVQSLADDLTRWLKGAPVRVSGNAFGYRLRKFIGRNRVAVCFGMLAALAIVAGLATSLWHMQEARLQRDQALAEARRSDAVRDYLILMLGDAVSKKGAGNVDVREVFRSGAERLFTEFSNQPNTGRTVALMLSDLFTLAGDFEAGAPLLEKLLAWEGIEADPDTQAHARYNLAQIEAARGNLPQAQELLTLAQSHWTARGEPMRLLRNESRVVQARIERATGKPDQAIDTLVAAVTERRALLPEGDINLGNQLNSLAIAYIQAGRYPQAIEQAAESHALFETLGLGDSDNALAALGSRCTAMVMQGRHAECVDDYARIVDLTRTLYGESDKLATALHNQAIVQIRMGHLDAALPIFKDAQRIARAHTGDESPLSLGINIATAELLARLGQASAAETMVDQAIAVANQRYAGMPPLLAAGHRAKAYVHLAAKRREDAQAEYDASVRLYQTMGPAGAAQIRFMAPLEAALQGG